MHLAWISSPTISKIAAMVKGGFLTELLPAAPPPNGRRAIRILESSQASRIKAPRQALESNGIAPQATEAGIRPAIDVLQARRLWVQTRANFARSRYDYLINVLKLQQAAGILSDQSLSSVNTLLREPPPPVP
jgi:hypothetical protein